MTTMSSMTTIDVLTATRRSLHRAAEHLLAASRKRATGDITLVPAPGGVATPPLPDGGVVSLEGTDVVVRRDGDERRVPLTTLAETGAALGLQPGFPWSKHPPGTEYEPDAALPVDPTAAAALAGWFALGYEALSSLVAEISAEQPSEPAIFPEHFDLGVTAGPVNYGFSPGDDAIPAPYVYIGPHDALGDDPFWNAPFGAYRTWEEIPTPAAAMEFLRAGRAVLGL
jgi:hypothetical protein